MAAGIPRSQWSLLEAHLRGHEVIKLSSSHASAALCSASVSSPTLSAAASPP